MKIPLQRYRCPLGRLQPNVTDLEAVKESGWREQRVLVVSDTDERLDFVEREFVRRLGDWAIGRSAVRFGRAPPWLTGPSKTWRHDSPKRP